LGQRFGIKKQAILGHSSPFFSLQNKLSVIEVSENLKMKRLQEPDYNIFYMLIFVNANLTYIFTPVSPPPEKVSASFLIRCRVNPSPSQTISLWLNF
jgi:hypothetical protein